MRRVKNGLCSFYGATAGRVRGHSLVLCYHSVRNERAQGRGWSSPHRSVGASLFEAQMRWLKDRAEVMPLHDLVAGSVQRSGLRVAVTFDDGYFDNLDVAAPIMKRLGLPMTWFIATDFIDNPESLPWWDLIDFALARCGAPLELSEQETAGWHDPKDPAQRDWLDRRLRTILKSVNPERRDAIVRDMALAVSRQADLPLNAFARAEELAAIEGSLIELGGHTVTHPNVARCSADLLEEELGRGKERLEAISKRPVRWFAYPFGGKGAFNDMSAAVVRRAGFEAALTLLPGEVHAGTDPFRIPRIPISPDVSMETFRAMMLGAPLYIVVDRVHEMFGSARSYG